MEENKQEGTLMPSSAAVHSGLLVVATVRGGTSPAVGGAITEPGRRIPPGRQYNSAALQTPTTCGYRPGSFAYLGDMIQSHSNRASDSQFKNKPEIQIA